jgi:hypothetical protein
MKTKLILLFLFTLLHRHYLQGQNKAPKIIIKNEFCPPAEYTADGEMQEGNIRVTDEKFMTKAQKELNYYTIYKKLNNDYTVTKWKYTNTQNPKQIDSIIVINYGRQSDRLVYYKYNKSAGLSVPVLISANFNRNFFSVAGIRVGITRKQFEKNITVRPKEGNKNIIYASDEPGNSFFSFSFTNDFLTAIRFTGYWGQ